MHSSKTFIAHFVVMMSCSDQVPGQLLQRVEPGGLHHQRPHGGLQLAGPRQVLLPEVCSRLLSFSLLLLYQNLVYVKSCL
jgi:hypothetical protein